MKLLNLNVLRKNWLKIVAILVILLGWTAYFVDGDSTRTDEDIPVIRFSETTEETLTPTTEPTPEFTAETYYSVTQPAQTTTTTTTSTTTTTTEHSESHSSESHSYTEVITTTPIPSAN